MTSETIHNYQVEFHDHKAKAEYAGNNPGSEEYRQDKISLKEEMRSRGFLALVTLGNRIYFRKRD